MSQRQQHAGSLVAVVLAVAGTASFAVGWLSGGKIDDASTNYVGAPAGVWAYDSFLGGCLTGNETLLHSWSWLEGSIRMSIMFAGMIAR